MTIRLHQYQALFIQRRTEFFEESCDLLFGIPFAKCFKWKITAERRTFDELDQPRGVNFDFLAMIVDLFFNLPRYCVADSLSYFMVRIAGPETSYIEHQSVPR